MVVPRASEMADRLIRYLPETLPVCLIIFLKDWCHFIFDSLSHVRENAQHHQMTLLQMAQQGGSCLMTAKNCSTLDVLLSFLPGFQENGLEKRGMSLTQGILAFTFAYLALPLSSQDKEENTCAPAAACPGRLQTQ